MNKKYHIDLNENYQKELARILKAKRLEQGKSLEEVSKGICSTVIYRDLKIIKSNYKIHI